MTTKDKLIKLIDDLYLEALYIRQNNNASVGLSAVAGRNVKIAQILETIVKDDGKYIPVKLDGFDLSQRTISLKFNEELPRLYIDECLYLNIPKS